MRVMLVCAYLTVEHLRRAHFSGQATISRDDMRTGEDSGSISERRKACYTASCTNRCGSSRVRPEIRPNVSRRYYFSFSNLCSGASGSRPACAGA